MPPVLCSPQNGINSLELIVLVLGRSAAEAVEAACAKEGAELGNGKPGDPSVLCVLYPSGTDFLTRMPTLSREDWVSSSSGGDCVLVVREKNELSVVWLDGWNCLFVL